jgi:hypothetical protein
VAAPTTDRPTTETIDRDPGFDVDEVPFRGPVDASGPDQGSTPELVEDDGPVVIAYRPMLAAGLSSAAAAMVTGGIFGSWFARLLGLFAVAFGVFWTWLTLRSRERETTYQVLLLPAALLVGIILLIPAGGGGASNLPQLVRDAISSGQLLRPPVPFDPGWRPVMMVVFALLGFAAAWLGAALDKPRAAIAVPLPILALTLITQPDDGEFIAGLCGFVPLLSALALLFGGDSRKASELTKDFELKRALRAGAGVVAAIVALVVLSQANFLFPEPVYDPADQPQKPKPIPLSSVEDRVLFEIATTSPITGPWKAGALDIYDGDAWKLPPFDKARLVDVPADGVVDAKLAPAATESITITLRALGNATSLPGTTTMAKVEKPADLGAKWDPRVGVLRMPEGRVPQNVTYTIWMPPYPNAQALAEAPPPQGDFVQQLEIPDAPPAIARLLTEAPQEPGSWERLDFLRKKLREIVVATGAGVAKDISPKRVAEIFEDPAHEASPYEIVAAEAMLARWAGVPSRIGYGFDGFNDEEGLKTIRPANAAQWLEVYFEGHGWVPLIEAPEQAKQTLDNEDAKFDPNTVASDEVAVDLYIPVRIESIQLLYERIRAQVYALAPFVALAIALYLSTPALMKQWRRTKRRRWAAAYGPRTQIAVEYAEFRDLAHDLNVGDPLDTPLEYLKRVIEDGQHEELAWLVSRSMYGDLALTVGSRDVAAAEELSSSLRRRMFRAQPFQARVLAFLSKASLRQPYTDELPNVVLLDPLGRYSRWRKARRAKRRATTTRRAFRLPVLGRVRVPAFLWGRR